MKRKFIPFRKSSFKKTIKNVYSFSKTNKYMLLCANHAMISGKQLECCRVTVSRLTKNGVKYWNNQNYRQSLLNFNEVIDNSMFKKSLFCDLKKKMISFFRKRNLLLKQYKIKDKKKKQKKKQTNLFVKQKKQKDIFFKFINKKINYVVNNHLDLPLVKRSNKSRMGKGKSRVTHHVKFLHCNDSFFLFNRLDKRRKKQIKNQLNYKTNLNLYFL